MARKFGPKRRAMAKSQKYKGKSRYSRAKRIVGSVKRRQAKKGMDTKFVKIVWSGTTTSVQGSNFSNYLSAYVPILPPTNAQTGVSSVNSQSLWAINTTLYDRVRVNSVTVKIIPKANILAQNQAQNDSNNTSGDNLIHWVLDRDGPANLADSSTTIPALKQYPSYKGFRAFNVCQRTFKITYPKGVWLDTANPWGADNGAFLQRQGIFGGHSFFVANVLEDSGEIFNEPFATIEVSYNCVFQGTKPTTTTVDNGTIRIEPIEVDISSAVCF